MKTLYDVWIVSAGLKAQPVYKAEGPLPGRKQGNGVLGNWTVCLRLKAEGRKCPLSTSCAVFSCPLAICFYISLCPGASEDSSHLGEPVPCSSKLTLAQARSLLPPALAPSSSLLP